MHKRRAGKRLIGTILQKTSSACETHELTLTAPGPCKESELLLSAGSGSGAAQEERWGSLETVIQTYKNICEGQLQDF